jgi:hypothetical protein
MVFPASGFDDAAADGPTAAPLDDVLTVLPQAVRAAAKVADAATDRNTGPRRCRVIVMRRGSFLGRQVLATNCMVDN